MLACRALLVRRALIGALLVLSSACATSRSVVRLGELDVFTFRRGYANAYVLRGPDKSSVLVDSGLSDNASALARDLEEAGIAPSALRAVIVTHGHADHAGGVAFFKQRYGTRIVAGEGDRVMLARGRNDPLCPTSDRARGRLKEDQSVPFSPTVADVWVNDVLELKALVGIDGAIIPVPGHTPGSLIVRAGAAVFVGDLFRGGIVGSAAEPHFYMCDLPGNRRDIVRVLDEHAPTATHFFVGHFGPVNRAEVAARFRSPR